MHTKSSVTASVVACVFHNMHTKVGNIFRPDKIANKVANYYSMAM